MVIKVEERRGRIIIHVFNKLRLEWAVEPRYWRNPLIATALWFCLPLLVLSMPRGLPIGPTTLLTALFLANVVAISAIAHSLQTIGTGRLSFGPHFFVVIGGFIAALLNKNYGLGPALTFPAAFAFTALVGLALSPLTIISRGIYFTLITLILPLILYELIFWRVDIFGAETGIPGISRLISTGDIMNDYLACFYVSLAITLVLLLIVDKILRSRWGFMLGVINEDEDVAASFGIETKKIKVIIFTLTCGVMGVSGWLIAHYYASFAGTVWLEPWLLVFILLSSVLGGKATIYGAVLGSYFIVLSRDVLRAFIGEAALLALYLVLLAALYLLPEGLWGLYRKTRYREYVPTIRVRRKL
jgi:branched-chain amino acid transport system permease protein